MCLNCGSGDEFDEGLWDRMWATSPPRMNLIGLPKEMVRDLMRAQLAQMIVEKNKPLLGLGPAGTGRGFLARTLPPEFFPKLDPIPDPCDFEIQLLPGRAA